VLGLWIDLREQPVLRADGLVLLGERFGLVDDRLDVALEFLEWARRCGRWGWGSNVGQISGTELWGVRQRRDHERGGD
jgi:hypothetical protein